jgi:RND family efflux transporter MFP subunit
MQYLRFLTIASLIAVTLSACSSPKDSNNLKETEVIPVKLLPLNKSNSAATIAASGRFTTDDEAFLAFKTGGVINKILVKEGDAIHAGQLLATLNLTEINAQVSQAQFAFEKAQRDYQRITNLYKDSVASLEQMQNVKTSLDLSKQQLASAQFNKNFSEIRATQNGFVLKKMANEGQVIASGTSVLQTNGAHSGNWFLRVGVSDKNWSVIKINDKAIIHSETAEGKAMEGIVYRRSEGVDPGTGSFSIDIKLLDKGASVASGMFGSATIAAGENISKASDANSWSIPYDALLDGDGSNGYVFITNDNKTAQKVKVTIAGMEKDHIIISDGLQNATSLIISGSAYLTDKSNIKVIQ